MEWQKRALMALSQALEGIEGDESWEYAMEKAYFQNRWFEKDEVLRSLHQWKESLSPENIANFLNIYPWSTIPHLQHLEASTGSAISNDYSNTGNSPVNEDDLPVLGLILAGNIPLVGLQDVINGVLCGYKVKAKRSSDDEVLISHLLDKAAQFNPIWSNRVMWSNDLKNIHAAIATGSNNSSKHFEYYFRNIPHIIRKNRNSVIWVSGDETEDEILGYGHDVFDYFGLGCRNVTSLLLPKNYEISTIFHVWDKHFQELVHHNKYANNYTYHKALLLMNLDPHIDTGYVIAKENPQIYAPVGMIHYQFFDKDDAVIDFLLANKENIQVVVCKQDTRVTQLDNLGITAVKPGDTQCTTLTDFADNIDTIDWLLKLRLSEK